MKFHTKDGDFAQRVIQTAAGPQVVWIRIGNCLNRSLISWLEPLLPRIARELSLGQRLVEVEFRSENHTAGS